MICTFMKLVLKTRMQILYLFWHTHVQRCWSIKSIRLTINSLTRVINTASFSWHEGCDYLVHSLVFTATTYKHSLKCANKRNGSFSFPCVNRYTIVFQGFLTRYSVHLTIIDSYFYMWYIYESEYVKLVTTIVLMIGKVYGFWNLLFSKII